MASPPVRRLNFRHGGGGEAQSGAEEWQDDPNFFHLILDASGIAILILTLIPSRLQVPIAVKGNDDKSARLYQSMPPIGSL